MVGVSYVYHVLCSAFSADIACLFQVNSNVCHVFNHCFGAYPFVVVCGIKVMEIISFRHIHEF
nr:hypothetical protein [uncultured Methanobrevibacter sp.]